MAIITEKVYFTDRISAVPGWKRSHEEFPETRPFFRIDDSWHDCSKEQAAEIPQIHFDGVFVKILHPSIVQLWVELDEYMANEGIYHFWDSFNPGWDEASRCFVISFYHRIR